MCEKYMPRGSHIFLTHTDDASFSLVIYCILFLAAPLISWYYESPQLIEMLRVASIQIVVYGFNSIQQAYIQKNMLFRKYFSSTFSAKIISGGIGIGMALMGFGAWALVFQSLCMVLLESIIIFMTVRWRPSPNFSWKRGKGLYSYSWRLVLGSIINVISEKLRDLLVGKEYSSSILAYYDKGLLFPSTIISNLESSVATVLFPVISESQNNQKRMKSICRKWIRINTLCGFPLMFGLFVIAENFIRVVLTEKWLQSTIFLRTFSVVYIFVLINYPIIESIKAMGYSGKVMCINIVNTLLNILVYIVTIKISVYLFVVGVVFCSLCNLIVSMLYAYKVYDYKLIELIQDVMPTFLLGLIMSLIVSLLKLLNVNVYVQLLLQIIVGSIVYIGGAKVSKIKSLDEFVKIFGSIIKKA